MPDWLIVLLNAVFVFILGLFIKNYLPSYMDEKGKNLATKEDIQEITKLTEEVRQEFRKEMEQFNSDLHFKYDFYYKQYTELYCDLYAIVVQSEYTRYYIEKTKNEKISFDEVPFLTISPTIRQKEKIEFKKGESAKYSKIEEEIETPISQMNFDQLLEYIFENGALADQELIKNAVSYRLVENTDKNEDEGMRLQGEIVLSIIRTYNKLRRELKMEYSETELQDGRFDFEKTMDPPHQHPAVFFT